MLNVDSVDVFFIVFFYIVCLSLDVGDCTYVQEKIKAMMDVSRVGTHVWFSVCLLITAFNYLCS